MAMNVGTSEGGEDEAISTINTTPLVDVMLVLLIIFLITIPVVTQSVGVKLPSETNIPRQTKPENIEIAVTRDGDVYWGMQLVRDNEELVNRLKKIATQQPQPEVHIRGDQTRSLRVRGPGRVRRAEGRHPESRIRDGAAGEVCRWSLNEIRLGRRNVGRANVGEHHGHECRPRGRIAGSGGDGRDQHHAADRRDAGPADHADHHDPDPAALREPEHAGRHAAAADRAAAGRHDRRRLRRHDLLERRHDREQARARGRG